MINSAHNPRLQAVRKLQVQAKRRQEERAFVVEGVRLAEEALGAGWKAKQVFYTSQLDERGMALVSSSTSQGVAVEQVSEAVMKSVSQTETPQGLLVVLEMRTIPLPANPHFLLILDGLRDPGNMGTILRSALAAGVQGVLLPPGSVDAWSPKVLRAGMGAHFRLPIQALGWEAIRRTLEGEAGKLKTWLADSTEGLPHTRVDLRSPLALIIGGEAAGAGSEAHSLAGQKLHIPMPGGSESLNAAVAASILLFEVVRQRSL
jgi:TrmH family RNA methyltransferase